MKHLYAWLTILPLIAQGHAWAAAPPAAPPATKPATTQSATPPAWMQIEVDLRNRHLLNRAKFYFNGDVMEAEAFAQQFDWLCAQGKYYEALTGNAKPVQHPQDPLFIGMDRLFNVIHINKTIDALELLGKDDADYLGFLNDLSYAHLVVEDYGDAEVAEHWFTQEKEGLDLALHGAPNPRYARCYRGLGLCALLNAQPAKAVPNFTKAVEIYGQTTADFEYGETLNFLAQAYLGSGDSPSAKHCLDQDLDLVDAQLKRPDISPANARQWRLVQSVVLTTSGWIAQSEGNPDNARALMTHALDTLEQAKDPANPQELDYLKARSVLQIGLGELAFVGNHQLTAEELRRTEQGLNEALQTAQTILSGPDHPATADVDETLAQFLYTRNGPSDRERATDLWNDALRIRERANYGDPKPDHVKNLLHECYIKTRLGDYKAAEETAHQALEMTQGLQGSSGLLLAQPTQMLAFLEETQGKTAQAEAHFRQSLENARQHLEVSFAAMAEDEQLNMIRATRDDLDDYLSNRVHAKKLDERTYNQLLAWKGTVFVHQHQIRQARNGGDPRIKALLTELEADASNLKTLSFERIPGPESDGQRETRIKELQAKIEQIQAQLASLIKSLAGADKQVTCADLQALLPPGAAVVDFIEYNDTRLSPDAPNLFTTERCYAAFIVRRDSVTGIALGPSAPIEQAWVLWHGPEHDPTLADDAGMAMRKLIWAPLEPSLQGVHVVLLSPDGALGSVPFAALPAGENERGCLLEHIAIATVPVPQLLPRLLAQSSAHPPAIDPHGLLLVGDVNYNQADPPTLPPPAVALAGPVDADPKLGFHYRGDEAGHLLPLPGAALEIAQIGSTFLRCVPGAPPATLTGGHATTAELHQAIAGKSIIHIATHAFFAASGIASATRAGAAISDAKPMSGGADPGLLSGFYLAGANHPAAGISDDGILTAMEISQMDLSACRLLVLSGCETGLGRTAGGEGMLGLQRACELAGARTVVASLWRVDDDKTRQLMNLFYEQLLLQHRQPLVALRNAQLAILRQTRLDPLPGGEAPGVNPDHTPALEVPGVRPALWAPWILSGDPGDLKAILQQLAEPAPDLASTSSVPAPPTQHWPAAALAACGTIALALVALLLRRRWKRR